MPEFCTWWIESGPTSLTSSSSASCDETMCFVSWSAAIAASGDRAEREPLRPCRPRASAPPSRTASARPSPSRRGRRRAPRRRLSSPRSASRWQSMQRLAHGRASSRSSGIGFPQFVQVAERSVLDPRERGVDLRRAPAPSAPRACSRSRGRACPQRRRRGDCRTRRAPPRSRPRASRASRGAGTRSQPSMRLRSSSRAVRKRSVSIVSLLSCRGEQPLGVRLFEAVEHDDLVPGRMSGNERDARRAERRASSASRSEHRFVRASVLGRLRDAHLPRVAVTAGDARPPAPGDTRSLSRDVAALTAPSLALRGFGLVRLRRRCRPRALRARHRAASGSGAPPCACARGRRPLRA